MNLGRNTFEEYYVPFYLLLFALVLFFHLLHLHSADLQWQSEQGDEAVSIVVVVKITGGEGSQ